jgi:hypothetical protein
MSLHKLFCPFSIRGSVFWTYIVVIVYSAGLPKRFFCGKIWHRAREVLRGMVVDVGRRARLWTRKTQVRFLPIPLGAAAAWALKPCGTANVLDTVYFK